MTKQGKATGLSRRDLLASGVKLGAALVVGPGFIASATEAWATEVTVLKPKTMASLIQIARDIYPHDKIGDKFYAMAVKGYDNEDQKDLIEGGVTTLNALAVSAGNPSYVQTGWEVDRVALLKQVENTPFFQTVRGGLVVGLYNNTEVWGHFGYEGESFTKGGYIDRGFDDIDWI